MKHSKYQHCNNNNVDTNKPSKYMVEERVTSTFLVTISVTARLSSILAANINYYLSVYNRHIDKTNAKVLELNNTRDRQGLHIF